MMITDEEASYFQYEQAESFKLICREYNKDPNNVTKLLEILKEEIRKNQERFDYIMFSAQLRDGKVKLN
jgi:uncharacterized HAD superfamily protein